jgi:hypothetical protein
VSLPTLTAEERNAALAKAAEARKARSAALAEIAAGTLPVASALAGEDPRLHRVKVHRVLTAVKGVGKVRADQFMVAAKVDPSRRVQGLGVNQRKALTELLAA